MKQNIECSEVEVVDVQVIVAVEGLSLKLHLVGLLLLLFLGEFVEQIDKLVLGDLALNSTSLHVADDDVFQLLGLLWLNCCNIGQSDSGIVIKALLHNGSSLLFDHSVKSQ